MSTPPPTLILASRSPRRRQLLAEAGYDAAVIPSPFVDPDEVDHGDADAREHAEDLAAKKAESLRDQIQNSPSILQAHGVSLPVVILSADTICVDANGRGLGKPADADQARRMLQGFVRKTHGVVTGVCLVALEESGRTMDSIGFRDEASVTFGYVTPGEIDRYVEDQKWRGKAGGYNLFERRDAGWPISVEGDETTVVGLPMRRLTGELAKRGVAPHHQPQPAGGSRA